MYELESKIMDRINRGELRELARELMALPPMSVEEMLEMKGEDDDLREPIQSRRQGLAYFPKNS